MIAYVVERVETFVRKRTELRHGRKVAGRTPKGSHLAMSQMMECRACRNRRMHLLLPPGPHPAANAFVRRRQLGKSEALFDLDLHVSQLRADAGVELYPPGLLR
jgi:hypothetical protein